MSSRDIAISVKRLSKCYRMFAHPGDRIKHALTFGHMQFHRDFQALKDVSFDILKGETVGIIGKNGSGKSTLLQLICGILTPTSGEVTVDGRLSALLELGTGFHPEFTGWENVFFQGAVMGFTPTQMEERFDDIAAFADIGEFIDHPVRVYSSGMYVRLAFSVAVHADPSILVVDEALAVGDARFQSKCFRRFEKLKENGITLLVVSHATELITQLCDKAILLNCGELVEIADATTVVNRYSIDLFGDVARKHLVQAETENESSKGGLPLDNQDRFECRPAYNPDEHRWGNQGAAILDFDLVVAEVDHSTQIDCEVNFVDLVLKTLFFIDVLKPVFGLTVKTKEGQLLCAFNSLENVDASRPRRSNEMALVRFSLTPNLSPGEYFISVGVSDGSGEQVVPLDRRYDSIQLRIVGRVRNHGHVNMSPTITIADLESRPPMQVSGDSV